MHSWQGEVRAQLRLALPVIVVQMGLFAMGAVDAAFMGRYSAVEFAATSIGHTWSFFFLAFGMGTLTVLDPIVSQAWGARDLPAIARGLQRGLVLSVVLSVFIAGAIWPADTALRLLEQPEEVIPVATSYARISILGVPAFLIVVAVRQSMQAMHLLRPLVFLIVFANLLNVLLDWILIPGNLGVPALGAVGSAWGTVIARWSMVLAVPLLAGPVVGRYLWPTVPRLLDPRALARMLRLGLPIGFQFAIEIGAFGGVAVLVGRIGAEELAGHQTTITLASASFMIPLGASMAAAVRVGNEIGAKNEAAVRRAAGVALAGGAGVMLLFGFLFFLLPYPFARLVTDIDEVLAIAVVLLPIAAFFQVFDGTQIVATGILRGMADTRFPMFVHVVGFWCIGIPVGYLLAFEAELGTPGLWWGLVAGLGSTAVIQFLRVRHMLMRGVERIVIDEEPA